MSDWEHYRTIEKAFSRLIRNSKHYVYIEDELLVTSEQKGETWQSNKVGNALYDRIIEAHEKSQKWKAIILLTLEPKFNYEESFEDFDFREKITMHYSISSQEQDSVIAKLERRGIDTADYIQLYSLRTWGEAGPHTYLLTLQIYNHSKVMIVDDQRCLYGSTRVSGNCFAEMTNENSAIVIEDKEMVDSKMGGKDYKAGAFASGLRQKLMREHLGCDLELVTYVEDTFAQYRAYATEHYRALHTLSEGPERAASNEKHVSSSVVELAMRALFCVPSTAAWRNAHGGENDECFEPSEIGTRNDQYTKQLDCSRVPQVDKFIAYLNTLNNDDFKKLALLKGLFYLQHRELGTKTARIYDHFEYVSSESFVNGLYRFAKVIDPFSFCDPLDDLFCDIWHSTARNNTAIFRCVFYCQPDDCVSNQRENELFRKSEETFQHGQRELASSPLLESSFEQVDAFIAKKALDQDTRDALMKLGSGQTENKLANRKSVAKELLKTVRGHLVQCPTKLFVKEESEDKGYNIALYY
ncbi:hypothetical protein ACO0QE_000463 [Hanseniaspora vineae]